MGHYKFRFANQYIYKFIKPMPLVLIICQCEKEKRKRERERERAIEKPSLLLVDIYHKIQLNVCHEQFFSFKSSFIFLVLTLVYFFHNFLFISDQITLHFINMMESI